MSAVEHLHEPTPDPTDRREPTSTDEPAAAAVGRAHDHRLPDDDHRLPDDDPLSDDEVFHLLQCRRRRDAIRYLIEHDGGPVRMRDLAEQVAAWEHDTTVAALTSKQRQRVYIPLYQTHLPKLDDAGVIDYDQHRGRVTIGSRAEQLTPFLPVETAVESIDEPRASPGESEDAAGRARWSRYYLGALAASGVLLAGATLGVPPVGALRWVVVAGLIALLFAAVSVADPTGTDRSPPDE